jgi:anthranilate phosphoribosyltransferase
MLGPLANPAEPPFYLIGAFSIEAAELMAHTLAGMAIERAFVVHGEPGWDEPTPVGPFALFDVRSGSVTRHMRAAAHYGIESCKASDLAGGDVNHNAAALRSVFEGRDRGAHRDALLIGAALTLELTGQENDPRRAAERAALAIDSGQARELLEKLSRFGAAAP